MIVLCSLCSKEEALTAKIPNYLPLIENAIIHGLEPKAEGGTLTINAVKQGDNIVIDVIDTGVGIQTPTAYFDYYRSFNLRKTLLTWVLIMYTREYITLVRLWIKDIQQPGNGCSTNYISLY